MACPSVVEGEGAVGPLAAFGVLNERVRLVAALLPLSLFLHQSLSL
jgi:hypothetical protein